VHLRYPCFWDATPCHWTLVSRRFEPTTLSGSRVLITQWRGASFKENGYPKGVTSSCKQNFDHRFLVDNPVRTSLALWTSLFWARSHNCEKRLLVSSCVSVSPSIRLHGTTRLPMDGFSRNLIFEGFPKICCENSVSLKSDKNNGHCAWRPIHFFIISPSFLLKMRNVAENQNAHFLFSNVFFSKNVPFMR
jgi:hypothetical protein